MALASLILACQFQAPDPDPAAALLAMVNHRSQTLKSQALSSRELKSQVRGITVENVQNVRPRTSAAHVVENVENVENVKNVGNV